MLSAAASQGLVWRWNVDAGLAQCDNFLYVNEDHIKVLFALFNKFLFYSFILFWWHPALHDLSLRTIFMYAIPSYFFIPYPLVSLSAGDATDH